MEGAGSFISTVEPPSGKSSMHGSVSEALHASQASGTSNWHMHKMKMLLTSKDPTNSSNDLDQRRTQIREQYRARMKAAPKTLVQKTEEKKDPIERQLEESDHKLQDLLEFGEELVSNMKVANEKREQMRREHERGRSHILKKDLEKESIESIARFNEISAKWSELEEFKEPMALFEHLEEQKEKVAALMASKDSLIEQCQKEIDRINAKYYADQMAQANDVRCLVERIDRQIDVIKSAYKSHLDILENTINEERQTIALTEANKWKKFYGDMAEDERTKFDMAKQKEEFYAAEIARITAVQEELTCSTRIRLEKEAEMLEWELRKVRNTVLMNSEKLDYNYQVLQKRNEENIVISNQQKRRLAKLNENIASLKVKISSINKQHQTKLQRSLADIQKLHESISELEIKAQQFRANNKRKFDLVWEINFKELKDVLTKIYEIDRILYEQQLAIPWSVPDFDMTDINEISRKELKSYAKPVNKKPSVASQLKTSETEVEKGLVRNILRKIADRAGFLIEEKLFKILEPYSENEQCIVRLDNIFIALRVENVQMISTLTECFLPYAYCPNCSDGLPKDTMHDFYKIGRELDDLVAPDISTTSTESSESLLQSPSRLKPEERVSKLKGLPSCMNHYLVIEPVFVLTALNEFTKIQMQKQIDYKAILESNQLLCNTIPFSDDTIKQFWSKFKDYFPKEKRKLWTTLEHGLNHYVEVLKQRTKLDEECVFLRRQNMELKHLLQKFKV